MDDLSHEDIDALIDEAAEDGLEAGAPGQEAQSPEDPEDAIHDIPQELSQKSGPVPYDFRRPNSLSRGFERNVRSACESFSKVATLSLTNLLRSNVAVTFRELRVANFGEEHAEMANPNCLGIASLAPLGGVSLVVCDIGLMNCIFTKLLGGGVEEGTLRRDFTEIETGLARRVLDKILVQWAVANEKIANLEPAILQVENNPGYLSLFADSEAVLVLSYHISVEPTGGSFDLVIPLAAFEPVMDKYDPREGLDLRDPREREEARQRIGRMLGRATGLLSARFRERTIALDEISQLKTGDLLELRHPVNEPLTLRVEGKALFEAMPGQKGRSSAVQISARRAGEA